MKQHFFGRLAVLFIASASILVVLTYNVIYWGVEDKDNILDAHDAYYHYKFIETWGDLSDTTKIKKELENLQITAAIYSLSADTLCTDNYVWDQKLEKNLTYWTNSPGQFSLCDYISYQGSERLSDVHKIEFPGYVSFGDIWIGEQLFPATVIERNQFQVLLIITDYVYPNEWVTFTPVVILLFIFMFLLYRLLRHFLRPITLMQNRIFALESGDLDSKIDIIGQDELALLSKNFNTLISEIKKLLKQKERLLADVSHELRTPLAKMRLLSEIDSPSEKMERINKQIDTLDSIITNILISDKLAAPYSNLNIEEITMENLLQQGLDLSKNKNVQVPATNTQLKVHCDVVKIAIVIKNLLDNAEKYAPSDSPVNITYGENKGVVQINVIDRGPGIPETLIDKIMRPYVRGKNLQKSGFGLGLSICKRVMGAHNGTISATNNNTKGATFSIQWDSKGINNNAKK